MEDFKTIGFNIGWDHAQHGILLPHDYNFNPNPILEGYKAGLIKRGNQKPKETTKYIKKWLQLRRNAWKRDKFFDELVTPNYLLLINQFYCPITRVKLTYRTGLDTDWSVDRLDNNKDYVCGNLVVMSVKANRIKDTLVSSDIIADNIQFNLDGKSNILTGTPLFGLTEEETMRLFILVTLPDVSGYILPSIINVPNDIQTNPLYLFQLYLTKLCIFSNGSTTIKNILKKIDSSSSSLSLNHLIKTITHATKPYFNKVIFNLIQDQNKEIDDYIKIESHLITWISEDVWMSNPDIYNSFFKWVINVKRANFDRIFKQIYKMAYDKKINTIYHTPEHNKKILYQPIQVNKFQPGTIII
jgi:hypothetical protein